MQRLCIGVDIQCHKQLKRAITDALTGPRLGMAAGFGQSLLSSHQGLDWGILVKGLADFLGNLLLDRALLQTYFLFPLGNVDCWRFRVR